MGLRNSKSTKIVPYVTRFFQLQSSMPRMRTEDGSGQARVRIFRKSVGPETCIPSLGASRSPSSPQVANPSVWRVSESRLVMRAYDTTSSERRSVKILPRHEAVQHTHLRTESFKMTRRPPQGRSATVLT